MPFLEEHEDSTEFAVARDDEERSSWASFMTEYGEGGIPHAFVVHRGEVVWHGHSSSILYGALPDLIGRGLIDQRMASRPVAPFSGAITHAGTAINTYSTANSEITILDNLTRSQMAPASYDPSTGTFTTETVPMGSCSIRVTLTDSDGRRFRGATEGRILYGFQFTVK